MHAATADERGVATTELVVVMPVLLTAIMLIVQVGLWFHAGNVVHAAAQEGARAARAEHGTATAGEVRAAQFLHDLGSRLLTTHAVQASRTPTTARVEVTGRVRPVVPGFAWPVRAVAESPVERFTTP